MRGTPASESTAIFWNLLNAWCADLRQEHWFAATLVLCLSDVARCPAALSAADRHAES